MPLRSHLKQSQSVKCTMIRKGLTVVEYLDNLFICAATFHECETAPWWIYCITPYTLEQRH